MKAARPPKVLSGDYFAEGNIANITRFLEGPAESAASHIVAEIGALNIYGDEGGLDPVWWTSSER